MMWSFYKKTNEMENDNNMELGDLLEQRIQENFGSSETGTYDVSDDRLREMNKKLPSWSLEPPFSYLK